MPFSVTITVQIHIITVYGKMTGKPKRDRRLEIRLNDLEFAALKAYAESKQLTVAEIVRDYIKTLIAK